MVFLFMRLEKAHDREGRLNDRIQQIQAEHKDEIKSMNKESADTILEQNNKLHDTVGGLMSLTRTIGSRIPG